VFDIEAEEKLSKAFKQLVIGSKVVGEETTSKKPETINLLASDSLVWVIDPIDGTKNFTKGNHLFCIMVCLVRLGTPVLAVIFDPLNNRYIAAEEGSGSWLHKTTSGSAEKLKVAEAVKLDQMSGFLSLGGFRDRPTRDKMRSLADQVFKSYNNLGCTGHEYIQLVMDDKHFTINYRTFPWDHLPGSLIHSEAGGYQASFYGDKYNPTKITRGLVSVPSELVWKEIQEKFLSSYLI
jgi:fructose-1,6-bisphosphatase/inositol monophosphatase family enzyme